MKNFKFLIIVTFLLTLFPIFLFGCLKDNSTEITNNNQTEVYRVIYLSDGNGAIQGIAEQRVVYGGNSSEVTAVPNDGYVFVKWSDGITTATRSDGNLTADKSVTAEFAKSTYAVTYGTDGHGTIQGIAEQRVAYGKSGSEVTAVPNSGYVFVKWSDGITTATRTETNVNLDITVTAIFEKLTYSVTYEVAGNGTIDGNANQTVGYGESTTAVTAIPQEGYIFVEWSDGITTATRQDSNVTANQTILAFFVKQSYTVRYLTDGNGIISGEMYQTVAYGKNSASVTAIPINGYKFVKWSDGNTSATRRETNVNTDIYITAIFEKIEVPITIFTVSYITDKNGTISGDTSQTVAYGKNSTSVTAIPNEGYRFAGWSDGLKSATRREINVNADITVTATFEKITYTVKYIALNSSGYIAGESSQTVAYGEDSIEVTAVPGEGCKFVKWSDGNTNPTRQETNVKGNISLTATFEKITYTITYTTDGNGTIEGAATQTLEYGKSSSWVTAVPNEGYKFVQWSDGHTFFRRQDSAYEDKAITAIFEEITLQVTYRVEGGYFIVDGEEVHKTYTQYVKYGGDTTKKLKPILYNSGKDFTYKYVFIKWSDGVEAEERQDFNVTEEIYVTAIFGIKLTYSVDGNKGGKLTGKCIQLLEEGNDAEPITAVPDDGYVFDGWGDWSEQMMSAERQDMSVVKSTNYVAYFAPIEKTFRYDYGELFGAPLQDKVVINRYKLNEVKFVLPELLGYTFCGWYTDKNYTMKFANENGKLMLGYYTFNLETDTIYARWKPDGEEEILTYHILTLCVQELHVPDLQMYVDDDSRVDVHFTMSAVLRKLYAMYSIKAAQYLNAWFEGKINFEIDTYFTIDILGGANLSVNPSSSVENKYYYRLNHLSVSEISDLLEDEHIYRNVMAIYDFGPKYSVNMRFGQAGQGFAKYAHIFIDYNFPFVNDEVNIYVKRLEREFNTGSESFLKGRYRFEELPNLWDDELCVYLHELCHTIQFKLDDKIVGDFHKVEYGHQIMEAKNYLLGVAVVDGKIQAIPSSYWTEGGKNMF